VSVKAIFLAKWLLELCVILRPRQVSGPPRQIKWFVGLQAVSLAFPWWHWSWCGTHLGREGLLHFITVRIRVSVLLVILAIQAFLIWKVWMGKNWARLTLLAWFLLGCIESLVQHLSAYPGSRPGEHYDCRHRGDDPASVFICDLALLILQTTGFDVPRQRGARSSAVVVAIRPPRSKT
jgi:hypothetical protein